MTTATGEKLGQTGVQDDYGQALAEGEITRLLKTVQAAQFKKSEKLATTENTEFKWSQVDVFPHYLHLPVTIPFCRRKSIFWLNFFSHFHSL